MFKQLLKFSILLSTTAAAYAFSLTPVQSIAISLNDHRSSAAQHKDLIKLAFGCGTTPQAIAIPNGRMILQADNPVFTVTKNASTSCELENINTHSTPSWTVFMDDVHVQNGNFTKLKLDDAQYYLIYVSYNPLKAAHYSLTCNKKSADICTDMQIDIT